MLESTIQAQIVAYLRAAGWYVRTFSQDRAVRRQMAGFPDVVAFRFGTTLLVEVKAPGGKRRQAQREFAVDLMPHLADTLRYVVARRLEDVVHVLGDGVV